MTTQTQQRVHGRPKDTLAARLILVRHECDLSQREAADATGVTYGEWQSMEKGRKARALDEKIQRISDALGYDKAWLMWGGPLDPPTPGPKINFGCTSHLRLVRDDAPPQTITLLALSRVPAAA